MKSSITIAVSDRITSGPWIFWNDLEDNVRKAKELGFDAVELFCTSGDDALCKDLEKALSKNKLDLSAVGTGAGKVVMGLTLSDEDPEIRRQAVGFIKEVIRFGARFNAPAIIGSMQGWAGRNGRSRAFGWLREGLKELSEFAGKFNVPLILEPLNRYETDLFNTIGDTAGFLDDIESENVLILADLFHMNIEEESMSLPFYRYGNRIGHIHFADSNRRPVGCGHSDLNETALAIRQISYQRYISAEAFPYPDSERAAARTIAAFRHFFG